MRILAISGSLRQKSSNTTLLRFIETLFSSNTDFILYDGLADLPPFNPDQDGDEVAQSVTKFRKELHLADAVIICTPEYAYGVPGSLKNALDWIVSSGEFMKKPTSIISASPSFLGGDKAFESLRLTLSVMEANLVEGASFMIPSVSQKIDLEGQIIHIETLTQLQKAMDKLAQASQTPI